jgi:hypothetical protein
VRIFQSFTDRVFIGSGVTGTTQTYSVPGLDPETKVITIAAEKTALGDGPINIRSEASPANAAAFDFATGTPAYWTLHLPIDPLDPKVRISLSGLVGTVRLWLIAEWGGPNVIVPSFDYGFAFGLDFDNSGTFRSVDLNDVLWPTTVGVIPPAHQGNISAALMLTRPAIGTTTSAYARPSGASFSPQSAENEQPGSVLAKVDDNDSLEVRESGSGSKPEDFARNSWVFFVFYVLRDLQDDGTGAFFKLVGEPTPAYDGLSKSNQLVDMRPFTDPNAAGIYYQAQTRGTVQPAQPLYLEETGSTDAPFVGRQGFRIFQDLPVNMDAGGQVRMWKTPAAPTTHRGATLGWLQLVPPPEQAFDPDPSDGEAAVPIDQILSWSAGLDAQSHDVYFGTDPNPGPAEFQGNQPGTTFDPGGLVFDQQYFWRIDEVGEAGTTTGVVWGFTTGDAACLAAEPSAYARVGALRSIIQRVGATSGVFHRVIALSEVRHRVLATDSTWRRVGARVGICGKVVNMKVNALCPDEMAWESDNVLDLDVVVDDLDPDPVPITAATSVSVSIFDADDDQEVTISPITLIQVGTTNHWRATVLVNATNGFSRRQRLRLIYDFDGGPGLVAQFEGLAQVTGSAS